ncbi:hypothetical protein predicted by Glimmer/Critica [Sorangium cellulosum So ce56]|uniref:Twin-arginine translocation signal domain-containing protein n=1 Tax=Sorangium cellulosum (strain So ce56) TaxID=448385 RepID=A9G961_SORC5|nr:hypothetical protein predicted by Glimmer/Critica [Sorangium cellulosum So ce56]
MKPAIINSKNGLLQSVIAPARSRAANVPREARPGWQLGEDRQRFPPRMRLKRCSERLGKRDGWPLCGRRPQSSLGEKPSQDARSNGSHTSLGWPARPAYRSQARLSTSPAPGALPIENDSTSNGEYVPRPLDDRLRWSWRTALERIEQNARHAGMSRGDFLRSTCGAATALLAIN